MPIRVLSATQVSYFASPTRADRRCRSALAVMALADPSHHALAIVAEGLAVAAADRPMNLLAAGIRPGGTAPLYVGREAHARLQLTEFVRTACHAGKPAAFLADARRARRARQP